MRLLNILLNLVNNNRRLKYFPKSSHLEFSKLSMLLRNISSCISLIKHAVMLRVGRLESELYLPAMVSTELFTMMVKLTTHWIMFPFWPWREFSPSFQHGRSDCSFKAADLKGPFLCLCHVLLAVIFIRGGMARAAQLPHVSTASAFNHFPWANGLGADKVVCTQHIANIAFHYNKTVSLSHKANRVHLNDIISLVIHRVAEIQGLLTFGSVRPGNFRPKSNTMVLRSSLLSLVSHKT